MKTFVKNIYQGLITAFVIIMFTGSFACAGEGNGNQKVSVIIVGHGGPARDFPKLKEYFRTHDSRTPEAEKLEDELVHWPRNENNDAYWAGFTKVVNEFKKVNNFHSVHFAFNEMCSPTVEEALTEALKDNPDVIVLTSIMLTPGGVHSEKDIPKSVEKFQKANPGVKIIYAWPYNLGDISKLLLNQVDKFIKD